MTKMLLDMRKIIARATMYGTGRTDWLSIDEALTAITNLLIERIEGMKRDIPYERENEGEIARTFGCNQFANDIITMLKGEGGSREIPRRDDEAKKLTDQYNKAVANGEDNIYRPRREVEGK